MARTALMESHIPGLTPRRGKVRDIYDFDDKLLIVATDRISAFDQVLPAGIPDKGRVLTGLTEFWASEDLICPFHLITTDLDEVSLPAGTDVEALVGRSMLVHKCQPFPVECVVRGYITGSGWKDYCKTGKICGISMPAGLVESKKLPEPIFTPATKAEEGHDENISFEKMTEILGDEQLACELKAISLAIYENGSRTAKEKGVIIADTKFEFGQGPNDEITLIDEVLTPDSSRFWPAKHYEPGRSQPSFDKQFVRDWLEEAGWDKHSPPPQIPHDIIRQTREKYVEAFERITGRQFLWR